MFLGDASSVLVKATQRALRQLVRESRESSASDKKKGIIVSALLRRDMSVLVPLFHVRLYFFFTSSFLKKIKKSPFCFKSFCTFHFHHCPFFVFSKSVSSWETYYKLWEGKRERERKNIYISSVNTDTAGWALINALPTVQLHAIYFSNTLASAIWTPVVLLLSVLGEKKWWNRFNEWMLADSPAIPIVIITDRKVISFVIISSVQQRMPEGYISLPAWLSASLSVCVHFYTIYATFLMQYFIFHLFLSPNYVPIPFDIK